MRGKRSKQYRKLMQQYGLSFGFREPYQVLLDSDIIKDADKFKMDLIAGLERTLHGQVKPMITQCSMRHLYATASEPGVSYLIDKAKTYERRRCDHRPEDYPTPLSTKDCLTSVVDPKGNNTNKHRYVVASQALDVRKHMRGIMGVPLVYINRSVMIMEPMAEATAENREKEERVKFRAGLKRGSGSLKRKREDDVPKEEDDVPKKKKTKGPKEPNPLSVMKSKKPKREVDDSKNGSTAEGSHQQQPDGSETLVKKKRKRKHKSAVGDAIVPKAEEQYRVSATYLGRWTSNMPESVEATTTNTSKPATVSGKGEVAQGSTNTTETNEVDDFGLPVRKRKVSAPEPAEDNADTKGEDTAVAEKAMNGKAIATSSAAVESSTTSQAPQTDTNGDSESDEEFKDAQSTPVPQTPLEVLPKGESEPHEPPENPPPAESEPQTPQETINEVEPTHDEDKEKTQRQRGAGSKTPELQGLGIRQEVSGQGESHPPNGHTRGESSTGQGISEWSHQHIVPRTSIEPEVEEDEWQTMPAYAPFDMYDDDNRLIAKEAQESDEEKDAYAGLGGAGKGYTRVQLDEDAQSATSLDENTQYLFKDVHGTGAGEMEDEEQRDAVSQMQATKDLLTEGQRIAYVGMTRLILSKMLSQAESMATTKGSKKEVQMSAEAMKMWSQKMMVRLYAHMEISTAEQIMIEQLTDHGVVPSDLTPTLMQNSRVKNPMAEKAPSTLGLSSPRPESTVSLDKSPRMSLSSSASVSSPRAPQTPRLKDEDEEVAQVPPPYQEHEGDDLPEVRTPSQLPTTSNIDIDLRWTVLCDLFLTLIADSVYDARSRVLLEKVGDNMDISWLEICRFEKRVTDALEMQQAAEKENWNEDEHKENRRKLALKKRYVMMGLATVGGGLVIGLSAGLLAPLIGAGLAAGFTTIGVAGTSGFLAGTAGAAIITSGAAASGSVIAVRAANRRTGAVKTFEYRPLHNNKRVNLIITVSGWMTGKVDDVRLPYSTVDPIMGDIYSVLWEPEMLTSMGDTINILATEGLQQVLGSTILISLMAALQLPVVLTKLAYLIDNPWTVSLDRANMAGLILADSLIDRNLGTRPITFVGYSLGSRVIFSCLKELSKKGAYGLVQNVFLFGSPVVANRDEYLKARSVVAGRFVNGYATNDWILGYLFRLTSGGISRVAGLAPIENIPELENINVTEFVPGHMSYRTAMPRLLREVGWVVESDEFTEIEDPDPENHAKRQRELINEIEEARKEFEKQEKEKESKGKFGFFSRKKKAAVEKKEWETYEEFKGQTERRAATEDSEGNNHGVLFDIDAIRAELASEQMEVKELKSTLPPMKLDLGSSSSNPRNSLRETKSYDAATMLKPDFKPSPSASPRMSSSNEIPAIKNLDLEPPRSARSSNYHYDEEEKEVQMTFDEPYHTPIVRTTSPFKNLPSLPPPGAEAVTPLRPDLKSSKTMPTSLPAIDINHNAWADDDDEFGAEKEIQMTFA
ncbi:hypothetical protein G7Y89_g2633 [Cudoniella acicularis]|uniref:U three protein 23 n=1 Tax=Cudoniella acicularis TaxID=354080 RepID=A0A8H4W6S2_9HELO|nr:hypothetical protein G7Y89_g2633 [Cudoniella acicularis]